MKKIKIAVAAALVMMGLVANCSTAQAAEADGMDNTITVRRLTEQEAAAFDGMSTGIQQIQISEEFGTPADRANASYSVYEYSDSFGFYKGDLLIARAVPVCTVWRYTDGKVHLYRRTISIYRADDYSISKSYGSIVNTDGSVSYTTGDRVTVYDNIYAITWTYAIDFYVTPETQYFSCYGV